MSVRAVSPSVTQSAVAITGGTINGTTIGGTTPAAGTFTTLSATGNAALGDAAADRHTIRGIVTQQDQPAFLATLSASATNVTGNGTVWTVACNTEVSDQSGSYDNATFTFTAPVAGIYLFGGCVSTYGWTANIVTQELRLVTTARTMVLAENNAYAIRDNNGESSLSGMCLVPMAVNDTVTLRWVAAGEGSDVMDARGGSNETYFWGIKVS